MPALTNKKIILTFIGHYLPGYKAGGAVRTIANMVNFLSEYFEFKVITGDRDLTDSEPYKNVEVDRWNSFGPNNVFYSSLKPSLRKIIKDASFDLYYLNSLFDYHFSIKVVLLRKLKLIPRKDLILAPRGELMNGALSVKLVKKRAYILLSKIFNFYNDITWHASNENEIMDIKREYGNSVKVIAAPDIPNFNLQTIDRKKVKEKNNLKILFISVISPKKNLLFVIETLNKVQGNFILDIYGPVKDEQYLQECKNKINSRIKERINFKGVITNDKIHEIYPNYDLMFFPTLGESFGHVIYESLFFGCPVLCSDTTPWNDLQKFKAGWNFSINNSEQYLTLIENLILLDENSYSIYTAGCKMYLAFFSEAKNITQQNLMLFES